MRIQTQGYSNKVWLSSDAGVIQDTLIMSAPTVEKILQAVNEKYGTSFEGWSQLPTAYEVGDTIPNWNAYEKIEFLKDKIKLKMSDNMWSFASIRNNTIYVAASDEHSFFVVNDNGEISQILGGIEYLIERNWVPKLSDAGLNYEVSQEIVDYQIGQSLEYWNRYMSI